MRTLEILRRDLKRANIEAVADLANVSTKTLYRIRQAKPTDKKPYAPGLDMAERIDAALDCVPLAPPPAVAAMTATKRRRASLKGKPAEEQQEA